jgi:N-acetylglucosamine kinase-like BadF-type ATPase
MSVEMIRMVMRAWDGRGKPTLLTKYVLEALELPDVETLLSCLYHDQVSREKILDIVPLLFEAANQGDEVARELITNLGVEVGITANAMIRRLGLERSDVEVVLGGSVFKGKGNLLLDTINRSIHQQAPQARVKRLWHEPVVGAALLALEALGIIIQEPVEQNLMGSLPARLLIHPQPGEVNL